MKTLKKNKPSDKSILIGILVLIGAAILVALYVLLPGMDQNYAKETITPLKDGLISGGAVEKCSSGSTGRGMSNRAPNYTIVFETSLNRNEAAELVNKVASANGYKMTKADSSYAEITSYYDRTTKKSPYGDLNDGSIALGMTLYDGGKYLSCENSRVTYDKEHTAIKVDMGLPEYR